MKQILLKNDTLLKGMHSNYRIIEKIGSGSFGNVYKAIRLYTSQIVAIKMPKQNSFSSNEYKERQIKRFERELEICGQMSHPNIVKLIDKGHLSCNEPFAVFEYIEGSTLKNTLLKKGAMQPHVIKGIMRQLLLAIMYMHANNIVHRDLKPQNIMITAKGSKLVVVDFGISALLNNKYDKELCCEERGTATYAMPQQLTRGLAKPCSDIYAWGLVLIECFTGYPIIRGNCLKEIIQQQLYGVDKKLLFMMFNISLATLLSKVLSKTSNLLIDYRILFNDFLNIDFNGLVFKHGITYYSYKHSYIEQPTLIVNV